MDHHVDTAQYFVSPEVKPWNIDVTTASDGAVTLRGEVDSDEDRQEAVRIARATEGVTPVDDELRVAVNRPRRRARPAIAMRQRVPARRARRPAGVADDAWITTKIQSKYLLDAGVKGRDIDVEARNGVVTLTGSVESDAEKQTAEEIARETQGVTRVESRLTIAAGARR